VLLIGAVVSIAIAQGGGNDVERSSYLRENARLLAQVPSFPGASRLLVIDAPWRMRQDPYGGSYVAGYVTRALYRAPSSASVTAVSRFYARAFVGWRLNSWGWSTRWPRRFRNRTVPENRCYAQRYKSACVELSDFYRARRFVRGAVIVVTVDYRAFEQRTF
jgi:hypothetical protein